MSEQEVHNTPSEVTAEEGEVMLDGPAGTAVSLTPDAALETSERLFQEGLKGKGQQIAARRRRDRRPGTLP
jgi:hypothetical protein